jgi:peptidoglycan-N-acetylglucosamine deacetylase
MRLTPPRLRHLLVLLAALGLAALVPGARGAKVVLPTTTGTQPPPALPPPTVPPATSPAPTGPAPPLRFRPVGCESHAGVYRTGGSGKVVALSFDDGPSPYTARFVSMLEAEHVPATFFMIGREVSSVYAPVLRRELRDGDALGDHTFTHADLVGTGDVVGQLQSTVRVIQEQSGYTPCVFRPPYGAYDSAVVGEAGAIGLATIMWAVDPSDWALPGTQAIVSRVLAQVQPGAIILSHDGGGDRSETLAAYPSIIRALRARGYRFETVPELLGFRPVFQRCARLCDGLGLARSQLPRRAIVLRG